MSSRNLVKLLLALNKSLYRWTILRRVELLSRMKAIFEWALVIDCNLSICLKMIVARRLFGFFWWSFCYLCQCFCIVWIHIVQKLDVLVFQLLSGQCVLWKVTFFVIRFSLIKTFIKTTLDQTKRSVSIFKKCLWLIW